MTNTVSTPLVALEAILLDTETTGLDPRKARIIEIGAVEWLPDQPGEAREFQSFVAHGEGLPRDTVLLTGINSDSLRDAPAFAPAFARLLEFAGTRAVIGHSIGFDFAAFDAEAGRAGVASWRPVTLDTRYLAQLAFPRLTDFTLESVARKCGVAVAERHRALADAKTCGLVMSALAPALRERGIRTFGEAVAASARLMEGENYPALWAEPVRANEISATSGENQLADPFLFSRSVEDVMSAPPAFVSVQSYLRQAIELMASRKIGSVLIGSPEEPVRALAILTERDVLRAIASKGHGALEQPASAFASRPLQTVQASAFLYRAVGRMYRLSIRHLVAVDQSDRAIGVISARDLLRSRMSAPVALGDGIDNAVSVMELGGIWATLPAAAGELLQAGMGGRGIAAVIAREVAALTRRAAQLVQDEMLKQGLGPPPCRYCVMVLGSAGRGESLLAFDQDNALVFESGEEGGPEDRWFARLGEMMCDILHLVGVPNCPGGVMAKNAGYRGSSATWTARAAGWIARSNPQDLLSVDIVFDMRPVHGDLALGEDLWRAMWTAAHGEIAFLKLLAGASGAQASPFGIFGRLKSENGFLDLKKFGLRPVVTAARILGLHHGVEHRSTAGRLAGIVKAATGHSIDLDVIDRGHEFFLTQIVRQQIRDILAGKPPSNKIALSALTPVEREFLYKSLRSVEVIPEIVRDGLTG